MINDTTPPASQKWLQCNGPQFRKLAQAGMLWLEKNSQYVNELNVFPVPDGDTGTNMLLTMRSAYGRIQHLDDTHVGKVAKELGLSRVGLANKIRRYKLSAAPSGGITHARSG